MLLHLAAIGVLSLDPIGDCDLRLFRFADWYCTKSTFIAQSTIADVRCYDFDEEPFQSWAFTYLQNRPGDEPEMHGDCSLYVYELAGCMGKGETVGLIQDALGHGSAMCEHLDNQAKVKSVRTLGSPNGKARTCPWDPCWGKDPDACT